MRDADGFRSMRSLYGQRMARGVALVFGAYLVFYLAWRATSTLNTDALWFSLLLLGIESTALINFSLFAFMTWDVEHKSPFQFRPGARADIFIPTYNEDLAILEATLVGCAAVTYPHTTYVLDDGRRSEVKQLATRLGCEYLTRQDNAHAKAGNLNEALARSNGEFIAILDADTVPQPDFFDRTLGYFVDKQVGLVQLPQEFYNIDSVQHAGSQDAMDLWHEQELFYRVIQPGKHRWGASFWCGSPSVVRRASLESVGGVATHSITEDLETTLRLHARGWKTVYHNEALAFGIAAQTIHAFAVQRLRWAQGTMQLLRSSHNPLLLRGLSMPQRLSHLASMVTYLDSYTKLVYLVAAPVTLLTGMLPVKVEAGTFIVHWVPYFMLGIMANAALGRGSFRYLATERYNMLKMFTFIAASTVLLWPRALQFRVTPKRAGATSYSLERSQLKPHFALFAFIVASILVGFVNLTWGLTTQYADGTIALVSMGWALVSGGLLGITLLQILRRLHSRDEYRFRVELTGSIRVTTGVRLAITTEDLSVRGCSVVVGSAMGHKTIATLSLELPDGPLTTMAEVVHETSIGDSRRRLGLRFRGLSQDERERLVEFLFVTIARQQSRGLPVVATTEPPQERRALAA
jgi:cellulose synthase/poly-beta-1,6-N-acetylglucosamine synthase-like glycosyltransferase